MTARDALLERLLQEILRDGHSYAAGLEPWRPTLALSPAPRFRRVPALARETVRDAVDRLAARAGFSRRHFDPDAAARQLAALVDRSSSLEATYALLGDDASRQAMVDLLKLRVLGPYHAPLSVTPQSFRAKQAYAERRLRLRQGTFEVSDPWFSPLSLYAVPIEGDQPIKLHAHSVDVASVFLLGQYRYVSPTARVSPEPGDVVLDVGGCWGDTALQFAAQVGPHGKVYTFEFDPESLRVLEANLELNPHLAQRIEVVRLAAWEDSGRTLPFRSAGRNTGLAPSTGEIDLPTAQTISLDDFAQQYGLRSIDFVKLDVEGAELSVLQGARRALRRFAPKLAVAAYHREEDLVRLPAFISELERGYTLFLRTFSPLEEETVLFASAGA